MLDRMMETLTLPRGGNHRLSVAPMMDRTDRHCRYFLRQISRRVLLYTEMVTTGAVLHGDNLERFLGFTPAEKPIALQLGGDDPRALAACARLAYDAGYDEVNLNVGCPSDRVQKGRFGACLMAEPARVAEGVAAMRAAVPLPITVKHRIGIDDRDRYADMLRFVDVVAASGCDRFTVHARKAWLSGLSPKENRNVPPLRHPEVWQLKRARPHLRIETNGGVRDLDAVDAHLDAGVDAVMIGRAAYDDPYLFADADARVLGASGADARPRSRRAVVDAMLPYVDAWCARGLPLPRITRHMLGLFAGQPGARAWRRHLTEETRAPGASADVLLAALARVPDAVADA
ncbi:MAG: tRNA dihydrouridine(20/20a) synthase DusA, partial [Acidobacteriota bacterium]